MTFSGFWAVVGALAVFLNLGCGSCRACGGPDLALAKSGPPECVTPCGMKVWFGQFGPARCDRVNAAETAAIQCFGAMLPNASPEQLCAGVRDGMVLLNSAPPPPYGLTWYQGRTPTLEIFNGSDWRANAYVHEWGHAAQLILYGDPDHDHMRFCDVNSGTECYDIYGAMDCAGSRIVREWR